MANDSHHLFVYGSLMRGMSAHHLMDGAAFVRSCSTVPKYALMVWEGFPALVIGDSSIEGELYTVSAEKLHLLDEYEGVPSEYERTRIELLGGDWPIWTHAYLLHPSLINAAQPSPLLQWVPTR